MNVEPVFAPLVTEGGLTLSYLVGMVREGVVYSSAMDVKVFAEVLSRNAGAFDMPTGISYSPGRIPLKLLILKLRLGKPKHEVRLVSLVSVRLNAIANAYLEVVLLEVVKEVIFIKL